MGHRSIMASFSVKSFERKLKEMSARQDSVQTVSLWLIHHRAHSKTVVNLWHDRVKKAKPDRRLILFYLANDVIQNSRKKGREFSQSFSKVLADSMQYLRDTSIRPSVERVLKIWQERKVFNKDLVQKLLDQLNHVSKPKAKPKPKPKAEPEAAVPKKENDKVEKKKKPPKRPVPANFKTINVTRALATMQGIEDETERRQTLVSQMRLDASSSEGIKQLKDYAGGNRFSLEFEESSTKYEDLVQSLEAESQQRQVLINLLEDGDAYYEAALKEATIIANAYRSFGNRLHSMKKKLDNKIRKFATAAKEAPVSAPKASFLASGLSGILEQMNRSPAGTPTRSEQEKKDDVKEEKKTEEDEKELNEELDPANLEDKEPVDPTVDHVEVADMDIESDSDNGGDNSEAGAALQLSDTNSSAMSTPKPVPSAPVLSTASPSPSKVSVQTTTPQFGYTMTVNSTEETETSSPASHDSVPSPEGSPELNLEIYEGAPETETSTQFSVMPKQSFLAGVNNEQKPGAGSPTVNLLTHLISSRRDGSSVEGTPERGSSITNTPVQEEANGKHLINLLGNLFPNLTQSVHGNIALPGMEVGQPRESNDQAAGDVPDSDPGMALDRNLVESEQMDSAILKPDSGPSTDEEGAGGDNTPEHGPDFAQAPPMILRSDATFPRPPVPPNFPGRFPDQAFQNRPSMARPPFMPSERLPRFPNEPGVFIGDGQRRPSIEEQLMEERHLREIRSPGLRSPQMSGPPMEWERRPPFGPRGNVLPANILGESRDPRLRRREQIQMMERSREGPPLRVPPIEMRGRPPGMEMRGGPPHDRSEVPPFMDRQGPPPIEEELRREENNKEMIRRRLSVGDEIDGPLPIEERERRIREMREGQPENDMRPELHLMEADRREGSFPFERHEQPHPMNMRERFHPMERDVPHHIDTRDGPMELRDGPPHMIRGEMIPTERRDIIHPLDRRHPPHLADRPESHPFNSRGPPIDRLDGPHPIKHRNEFHPPGMPDGCPPDEVPTSEEESPVDEEISGGKPPVGVPPEVYFSEGGEECPPVLEAPQIDEAGIDYSLDDMQFNQGEGQNEQASGQMFRSGMQPPQIRPPDERSAFDIRPGFHMDNHRPFGQRGDNNRHVRPMGRSFRPRHQRPGFPGPRNFHHRNFGPRNFRPRHENEGGRPRFPHMRGGPRLKRPGPPFHPDHAKRPHY